VIVHRALPWDPKAKPGELGGALWFPRQFQGAGRHDNPDLYGCIYTAERPVSAVAERLAPFRGSGPLAEGLLTQAGRPLALAAIAVDDDAAIVDLDDPRVLSRERLRPSGVATGERRVTQADAASLRGRHPDAAGIRWWSTLEASWLNVTLFDAARAALTVAAVEPLTTEHEAVRGAAEALGLA
jgi:hypothetical protein